MLVGIPPFYNENLDVLYKNIEKGNLKLPGYLSKTSRALLTRLLYRDPKKRPSFDQMKEDPFFTGIDWDLLALKKVPPPKVLQKPTGNKPKKGDISDLFEGAKFNAAGLL